MERNLKLEQIKDDLTELCLNIGERHVGSPGNQKATEYAYKRLNNAGFSVKKQEFKCIDWQYDKIMLKVEDEQVKAFISPYSLSCQVESSFETASNINELANKDFTGKIAVLQGELCKEQLMPKNFTFYNPDRHKEIIRLLEEKNPLAIITITGRNPELAGALYPFPLIEDGDFNIPVVYLTKKEGRKILDRPDSRIYLQVESNRILSKGYNVIGLKEGKSQERIVFCAHIDTKKGTPGALDNGSGVVTLLTLADLLKDYEGKPGIEILIINGEDYYSTPGQMLYLTQNQDSFKQVLLAVNTDVAGYIDKKTSFCCFGCEGIIGEAVHGAFKDSEKYIEIDPWYQSDHAIFVMNQVPAVALTSENYIEISTQITHTAKDIVDLVDANIISNIADNMKDLIYQLNG